MKQLVAEKLLWAIIDECDWLVAITAGDTAADGMKMYVGDQLTKELSRPAVTVALEPQGSTRKAHG